MLSRYLHIILFKLMHPGCQVSWSVQLHFRLACGRHVIIGDHCRISRSVKIGDNVRIGRNTTLANITIGKYSHIESDVKCVGTRKGNIVIGENTYIGTTNLLDTSSDITIGNFVHIAGPSTALWTHSTAPMCKNRVPLNSKDRDKYRPVAPIIIEDGVYIGCNSTIYPGIQIHAGSIVAPNSAVTKSVAANTMVGGVPAGFIKNVNS